MIEENLGNGTTTATQPQVVAEQHDDHNNHHQDGDCTRFRAGQLPVNLCAEKDTLSTMETDDSVELVANATTTLVVAPTIPRGQKLPDQKENEEEEGTIHDRDEFFGPCKSVQQMSPSSRTVTLSPQLTSSWYDELPLTRSRSSSFTTTKTAGQSPPPLPLPSSSQSVASTTRGVSFAMVEIREHPIIVGDHPGVKKGVPLSIGWESVDRIAVHVDRYEEVRIHHRRPARSMRLVAEHREHLLRALGFSREEMLWGQANAKLVRKLREKTNDRLSLDRFHEVWESIGRKLRNLVTLGKFKRRQKEYLRKHVPSLNDLEAPGSTNSKGDAGSVSTMKKSHSFIAGSSISNSTWLGDSNRRESSSSILSVQSLQESLGYLCEDDYF